MLLFRATPLIHPTRLTQVENFHGRFAGRYQMLRELGHLANAAGGTENRAVVCSNRGLQDLVDQDALRRLKWPLGRARWVSEQILHDTRYISI